MPLAALAVSRDKTDGSRNSNGSSLQNRTLCLIAVRVYVYVDMYIYIYTYTRIYVCVYMVCVWESTEGGPLVRDLGLNPSLGSPGSCTTGHTSPSTKARTSGHVQMLSLGISPRSLMKKAIAAKLPPGPQQYVKSWHVFVFLMAVGYRVTRSMEQFGKGERYQL